VYTNLLRKLIPALGLLAFHTGGHAANGETPLPITVEAETAQIDVKAGTSIYKGEVIMIRGNITIHADTLTIYTQDKKLKRAIAEGAPVRFVQAADPATETREIRGEGLHMEYLADTEFLILTEQAHLWQEANHFSGNRIEYEIPKELVKAAIGKDGKQRVQITIQPEE
jgi:lipopolysaccharide export system protein LptA